MLILIAALVAIVAFSVSPLLSLLAFVFAGIVASKNSSIQFLVVVLAVVAGAFLISEGFILV